MSRGRKKESNTIIADHGRWTEVDVSSQTHPDAVMKIDKADYIRLIEMGAGRICAVRIGTGTSLYAMFNMNRKSYVVHRVIRKPDPQTDHINGDGLDNRRSNLRSCTHAQNAQNRGMRPNNTSGFKGVYPYRGMWRAQIRCNKKTYYLGTFESPEEASAVYEIKARELHKQYKNGG